MCVDRETDLDGGRFEQRDHRRFAEQIVDVVTNHVDSEHLPSRLIGDDFHEALGVSHGHGLAERGQREPPGLHLEARLFGALLRVTDRADLWLAERRAQHLYIVKYGGLLAGDVFSCDNALLHRHVREHELSGDVTDGVNAGDVGLHLVVDGDEATLSLDSNRLDVERTRFARESNRDKHDISLEPLFTVVALQGDRRLAAFGFDLLDSRLHQALDVARLERALERAPGVGILERQHGIQQFDDRDVGAVTRPEVAELNTDRSRADDHRALWDVAVLDRLAAREDDFAIDLHAGKHPCRNAGR